MPSIRDNCLVITAITLAIIGDRIGVDPERTRKYAIDQAVSASKVAIHS